MTKPDNSGHVLPPRRSSGAHGAARRDRQRRRARGAPLTGAAIAVAAAVLLPGQTALAGAAVPAASSGAAAPAEILPPYKTVSEAPEEARAACTAWNALKWPKHDKKNPTKLTEYTVPKNGGPLASRKIYSNGRHENREKQLPAANYDEFDVPWKSYKSGTVWKHYNADDRGTLRLVRNVNTHAVWYSANHYKDFRKIEKGC